jgi:ComF family protein
MELAAVIPTVLDLVFPRECAGCGAPAGRDARHFCWDCLAQLEFITDRFCSLCGDPVDGMVENEFTCAACHDRKPHFDRARSVARYRGHLRDALQTFKYNHATHLSVDFVPLLAGCVKANWDERAFDAVTFVPLYPRRERERTYNQAALLAGGLARALDVPLLGGCLRRMRPTATQTNLSAPQRRKNIHGAFVAEKKRWIEGRSLLLVDDIMTTGATVDECAKILKKGGAAKVYVVTVARG